MYVRVGVVLLMSLALGDVAVRRVPKCFKQIAQLSAANGARNKAEALMAGSTIVKIDNLETSLVYGVGSAISGGGNSRLLFDNRPGVIKLWIFYPVTEHRRRFSS
jgi:hypothetical protein